jgi:squalene synthase HpnC
VSHYENFPVGSFLIPKNKRKYVYSIYAFARTADDIADSNESSYDKFHKLSELKEDLHKAVKNEFESVSDCNKKFLVALSHTIETLNIPVDEFDDLLAAFMQDAIKSRYEKWDELIEYSRFSANPIGHLILILFGYDAKKDAKLFGYSDKICTALQLTNFWQDVSVDLKIDRVYIPEEVMKKHEYDYDALMLGREDKRFKDMMKDLVGRTKKLFLEGRELVNNVHGRLKLEMKLTYAGGNEILNKIEDINYNVLTERVKLSKTDFIKLFFRTIF